MATLRQLARKQLNKATPANLKAGKSLKRYVKIEQEGVQRIIATVAGGTKRTVQFTQGAEGLRFRCSCSSKPTFCKHCIAIALR